MLRNIKNKYHLSQAAIASLRFRRPARKMVAIGITGTDGKTTTATLLHKILLDAGIKSAVITTIGAYIGEEFYDTGFHATTPSPFALQRYINKAKKLGCTHIIIETTSHALDQNRTWGIPFQIGVVTNITREHLDYHKTYENYARAKAKLLQRAKYAVLNEDDESFNVLVSLVDKTKTYPYSLTDKAAYINSSALPTEMKVIGEFNKQNALAAAAVAKVLGLDGERVKKTISEFTSPEGRQEVVHEGQFKVIVDFAHTPGAFEKVLPEIKKMTVGRLIHVFGAAGKRDSSKRPYMGNVSSKFADIIILTSEDPRGEKVEVINTHIMAGFVKDVEVESIVDRKKAIGKAISIARKGDTVLITGKGHEKSMNLSGRELPWSDRETVMEALQETTVK